MQMQHTITLRKEIHKDRLTTDWYFAIFKIDSYFSTFTLYYRITNHRCEWNRLCKKKCKRSEQIWKNFHHIKLSIPISVLPIYVFCACYAYVFYSLSFFHFRLALSFMQLTSRRFIFCSTSSSTLSRYPLAFDPLILRTRKHWLSKFKLRFISCF